MPTVQCTPRTPVQGAAAKWEGVVEWCSPTEDQGHECAPKAVPPNPLGMGWATLLPSVNDKGPGASCLSHAEALPQPRALPRPLPPRKQQRPGPCVSQAAGPPSAWVPAWLCGAEPPLPALDMWGEEEVNTWVGSPENGGVRH